MAAVLPLARALGGQVRTTLAGPLPWRRSSVNGCTAGGRTAELFHLFNLISVGLQEDQHHLPQGPALVRLFLLQAHRLQESR